MSERECLAAHTPCDEVCYPPYVNFTLVGSRVEITVRHAREADGRCGTTSMISLPRAQVEKILVEALENLRRFT